ncbi:hypothetical protein ACBJ59_10750 [Nonomuraea sp. MTCD27]|uniref:hypothetical protein n=1 Tax=Nonomuraea sp. MTCD27 TaxID=1676747 RepID=UPI0035C1E9C0
MSDQPQLDILERIDDVIAWDGCTEDAMVWTAESSKRPVLQIDPEAAQRAFADLGRQVQAFVDAFTPFAEQMLRDVGAVVQAFATIANSSQMRELAEAQQIRRRAMKTEYARRSRRRVRRG